MSGPTLAWALKQRLPGRLKRILDDLALRADDNHRVKCSQRAIADRLGVVERTVSRGLADLEALRVITRSTRRDSRGGRATDLIELMVERDFVLDRKAVKVILLRAATPTKRQNQPDILSPLSNKGKQSSASSHEGIRPTSVFSWNQPATLLARPNVAGAILVTPAAHVPSSWPASRLERTPAAAATIDATPLKQEG